MKQKLRLFAIHQIATSLQRTNNINPRTRWIKPDEIRLFHNPSGWKSSSSKWLPVEIRFFFSKKKHRCHILHFPNSTGLFTKPTDRHYTKYRFYPDIGPVFIMDREVGPWKMAFFHGPISWFDSSKSIYKAFGTLTRSKPDVDQEEWSCTKKWWFFLRHAQKG
jgi:hypothetical protein